MAWLLFPVFDFLIIGNIAVPPTVGGETSLLRWYQLSHVTHFEPWDLHEWRTHPRNANWWRASTPADSAPEWRREEKTWTQPEAWSPAWPSQAQPKSAKPQDTHGLTRQRWTLTVTSYWDFEVVGYTTKTDKYIILVFYPSTHNYEYKCLSISYEVFIDYRPSTQYKEVEDMIPTQRIDSLSRLRKKRLTNERKNYNVKPCKIKSNRSMV